MRSRRPPTQTFTHAPRAEIKEEEEPTVIRLEEASPPSATAERYTVRHRIGTGGMGTVDLVHDRVVGRDVALKQMRPEELDETDGASFEREARLQGQLEHPAIVPVYDLGRGEDGIPYFTMKRVRGESLASILDRLAHGDADTRSRFSRRKLLTAYAQLCLAAHYAHERGVVHRDIKPANVMLGGYGEVYLLDWGIATVRGDVADLDTGSPATERLDRSETSDGSIVGTLSTMAPEQAQGVELDARADVYALGAILFEILTLEQLHPMGESNDVMLATIVSGVDARASVRAPEADVPPELESVCVNATRRDRAERTPTALALHAAIEAYLDGDRDHALRQETARKHAENAQAIAAEAAADEPNRGASEEAEQRARALGEVGRALALDPSNADALRTLVQLLTHPPRHVPREVQEGQAAQTRRNVRRGGIAGAALYGYIAANGVFTALMGIRDWRVFWVAQGLWMVATLWSFVTIARPTYRNLAITFLIGASASLWITELYGPFLIVPSFLTMHASLFALVRSWRLRAALLAVTSLAWTASVYGEMKGLFSDTVQFVDGGILIHSKAMDLPEGLTSFYLYAVVLAVIVLPAVVIGALRSSYEKADEKMRLQTWQLQRLVPDDAARALEATLA